MGHSVQRAVKVGRAGGLRSRTMIVMMTENTPSENAASRSVVAFRWGMGPRFGISPIRIRQSCQIRYLDFPAIHLYGSSCHPPCRWRHHLSHEIRGFFRFTERAMPTCSGNLLTACSIVSWWAGAHVSKNDRLRPIITVPGTTLLTWIPSLIPCAANAFATVMIAALIAATAANPSVGCAIAPSPQES